ncbi:MAG: MerR family transcriptional regulator [Acetobacteraceae bacterium]|nr:MerR family transcriptional regulator [Acetobacteraceae bacterium]
MSGRIAPIADDADDSADGGRGKLKKAPNAFRTISEVADELHIPQHVLRFWETKFPQVKPLKRGGGRRYYRPDDIALLRRVSDLLYIQGYTIKGVQRLLREGGGKLSDDIPPAPPEDRLEDDGDADTASASDAPELPMPGLAPAAAHSGARRAAPRAGRGDEARAPDPRSEQLAAEAARLRGVLAHTLKELEALRALLP